MGRAVNINEWYPAGAMGRAINIDEWLPPTSNGLSR